MELPLKEKILNIGNWKYNSKDQIMVKINY